MLQDVLKPNAAIEEITRTTPACSFWGYTWRYLLISLASAIPAFCAYLAIGLLFVPFAMNGSLSAEDLPRTALLRITLSISLLVIIHLYCHKASGRSYASMGLVRKGAAKQYLIGLLFGVAVCAIHFGIAIGFDVFEVNQKLGALTIPANVISAMIFAPIVEMLATGYYFGGIASSKGVPNALVGYTCVSVLLGIAGISNVIVYVITSVLMPLFSCLYFLYSGSIWGAAAFSGALSLVDRVMFLAEDASSSYLAVAGTVCILVPLIGIAVLLYLLWRRNKTRVEKN